MTTGVMLAVLAAIAFGVTTPIVAWAGRGVGPLATAALLYAGAALVGGGPVADRRRAARRDCGAATRSA